MFNDLTSLFTQPSPSPSRSLFEDAIMLGEVCVLQERHGRLWRGMEYSL